MTYNNLKETVQVDSTCIGAAEYDFFAKNLVLTYKNGSSYLYDKVPNFVFEGLRNDDSKGRFINRHVLGKFSFNRL